MLPIIYKFVFLGEYKAREEKKVSLTLKLVGLGFLVHFASAIIKMLLDRYDLIEPKSHPAAELIRTTTSVYKLSIVFLSSVIITPFIEELSFRFVLKPNQFNKFLGFGFLIAFIFLLFSKVYRVNFINSQVAFYLLFIAIGFGISFLMKILATKYHIDATSLITNHLAFLIFVTSALFGMIHFGVVSRPNSFWVYIPLLLPYATIGYLHAYARLSMGFFYAVLCHVLNNLVMYILNVILYF